MTAKMEFNLADLYEGVADAAPDRTALICGDVRLTYAELDARANRLAHHLRSAGVGPGDHVGTQLYNGNEYVETMLACLKIRAVPINVNYRYVEDELAYLYGDSDIVALVHEAEFTPRVRTARATASKLRHLISVGGPGEDGSVAYEDALAGQSPDRDFPQRSGQDLWIIYTGGTTGMPKGVMWHQEDLFFAGLGGGNPMGEPVKTPEELIEKAAAGGITMMPAAPLMHGAAQFATFITFNGGGTLALIRKFDARDLLNTVEREQVLTINIVGDAMAVPICDELEAGGHDLSSLFVLSSTGAILSGSVRARLAGLLPNVMIMDSFGSTETGHSSTEAAGSSPETGLKYRPLDDGVIVLDSALRRVKPGSGEIGTLARGGRISAGYYNDPEKTAATYVEAEGRRWVLSGDMATVEADGTIAVLGRGSVCINSGGEKIYPEEVEAVLKAHPGVADAVVTGVPSSRYGEQVAAVVQPTSLGVTDAELDAHAREHLAGYKVPRSYAFVTEMVRSPSGKADYRWAKRTATDSLTSGQG